MRLPSALRRTQHFLTHYALFVMIALIVLFVVFLGTLAVLNHLGLRTQLHDVGHMQQSLWQVTQGNWSMILSDPYPPRPRFYQHANVVFYFLAPLYVLIPSAITLSLLQVLSVGLAGLGIFLLARKLTGNPLLSLFFGVAFLANPMIQDATLYDFHPEIMGYALVAFLFLCIEKKRWGWYWVLLLLLLTLKEDMAPLAFLLGFFVMKRASLKQGILTSAIAVVYLVGIYVFSTTMLDTYIGENQMHRFRYLFDALTDPSIIVRQLSKQHIRIYTFYLLSQGLLALASPLVLLPALSTFLVNTLDASGFQARITGVYYSGMIMTIICIASIYGWRSLQKRHTRLALPLFLQFFLQTLLFSFLFSPLPYGKLVSMKEFSIFHNQNTFQRIASLIPPEAALATQNNLGPHFMNREQIYEYPHGTKEAEYILLAIFDPTIRNGLFLRTAQMRLSMKSDLGPYESRVERAFADEAFGILEYSPPFYLFKRDSPRIRNEEAYQAAKRDMRELLRTFPEAKKVEKK